MSRLLLLLLLFTLVATAPGCKSDPSGSGGSGAGEGPVSAHDPADTMFEVIERLEAERSFGDGKLLRYLTDPDARVRARAALAIGRIGGRNNLLKLGPRLKDNAPTVRAAALFAAGLNRDDRFLTPALGCVLDKDSLVRRQALFAVGRIDSPRAVPAVIAAIKDTDPAVSAAALDACFRLRDARVVPAVTEALRSGGPKQRYHAANALERLSKGRTDPLTGETTPPEPELATALGGTVEVLLKAGGDKEPAVAAAALRALGHRSGKISDTEPLLKALERDQAMVVVAALLAILPQGDAVALEAHHRALAGSSSPRVRWIALQGISALHEVAKEEPASVRGALVESVERAFKHDPDLTVRAEAGVTLTMLQGAAVLETLEENLRSPDYRLRMGLALACGQVGGKRARAVLIHLVTDDDDRVRVAAIEGLGKLGDDPALQEIYRVLRDPSVSVRAAAAEALARAGDQGAVGPLRGAWNADRKDPSLSAAEARYHILLALVKILGRRAMSVLSQALEDPSAMVRTAAVDKIEELNGYRPEVKAKAVDFSNVPPRVQGLDRRSSPKVVLQTSKGLIRLELYPQHAPQHVRTFLSLVENGFYHGKTFHRVVPGHVVQGGGPEGTGYGTLDFTLRDEPCGTTFGAGALGMAKLGPDTGCCQFFITSVPRPHLDGDYTLFGQVQKGMDVVRRLMPGDRILQATWVKPQ